MKDFNREIRPATGGLKDFTDVLRAADAGVVAEMSVMTHDVLIEHQAKERDEWLVQEAARHPLVLAVMEFLTDFTQEETIEDDIKDRLARMLHNVYGVPPERSSEVFGRAEAIIWQDREEYGQA